MKKELQGMLDGDRPRTIRDSCISITLRLLVVAPHPDDFDAIGVALKFLSDNGNSLQVAVACTGSGVEDSYCPGLTFSAKAKLREREQRNSIRFFGLPEHCLTFLRLKNDAADQPVDDPENLYKLEEFVLEKVPDIIFLPHGNDTNSGHRVMYALVRQIALRSDLPLAVLLNRDPKTVTMRTDLYIPFGQDEAAWKAELLRFHDSQHQRNLNTRGHGFDDRILNLNRQIAHELSLDEAYAEAFELQFYNIPQNRSQHAGAGNCLRASD